MKKAQIGMVGLAVMGENLAMNMESHGFTVAVYDVRPGVVEHFMQGRGAGKGFIGAHSWQELADSLQPPRKVMLMIRAGEPVDQVIAQAAARPGAGGYHHRRRQQPLPRYHPPRPICRKPGLVLPGHRRIGRRGGCAAWPQHDAWRQPRCLGAGEGYFSGHLRPCGWPALLRLCGAGRRGSLC